MQQGVLQMDDETTFGWKSDLSLLDQAVSEYGGNPNNLITLLQAAQDIYGYLPKDVLYYLADQVGVSPADAMGVATFYSQFRLQPIGKYLIMSCQGTACHVNGSQVISRTIQEHLGIESGQTTEDGLFTLEDVACLGCCSLAPVITINGEAHGNLTPSAVIRILDDIRAAEAAAPAVTTEGGAPCA
ncbi:MAG: NADH-quinone oxidoreductase subunit NuoE [Coriobacteriia bacterium]|nr:NADH-quinone oxidoreductase subunit NuoE [Coriobacteriia bacterium]